MADRTDSPREAVSAGERVTLEVSTATGRVLGVCAVGSAGCNAHYVTHAEYVPARLLEEAVARERERCARIAFAYDDCGQACGDFIAAEIREGK